MSKNIEDFLNSMGYDKSEKVFTDCEIIIINDNILNLVKPTFEKIAKKINAYNSISASVVKSVSNFEFTNFELHISQMATGKYFYRINFKKADDNIQFNGEDGVPNIYGELKIFNNTALIKNISEIKSEDIEKDFEVNFKGKFNK